MPLTLFGKCLLVLAAGFAFASRRNRCWAQGLSNKRVTHARLPNFVAKLWKRLGAY
jgi:hypothetical protein